MYADQMRLGLWHVHAQSPILLDEAGRLQNGQHRLLAVIISGRSCTFPIVACARPPADEGFAGESCERTNACRTTRA